jgi:hypothetical protein
MASIVFGLAINSCRALFRSFSDAIVAIFDCSCWLGKVEVATKILRIGLLTCQKGRHVKKGAPPDIGSRWHR